MIKDFGFIIPQNCQFGMGALKKLPDFLKAAGSDNVMLISDRGLEAIGVVDKVREIIKAADLKYSEYLDVLPNPTTTIVDECAAQYKANGCTALIALGGGVIGVEMAAFYAATGTKVTIVEAQERLLPQMDREISQNLQMIFKRQGMGVHTRALARRISEGGEGVVMELDGGETLTASAVLAAVGRRPNTDGLCAPGVQLDMEHGFILVNERFETSLPGVYAIGDAIGGMMLAHAASAQGLTVVHALAGEEAPLCLTAIPACVYVSPEIASVGLTQADCQQRGIEVKVGKALMGANGRTLIAGGQRGFIKVVVSAENGRVLGAQLMCERATDMIDSFTVAIANGLTATQLMRAVRPHPTFLEAVGEALDALEGRAIHS